MRLLRWAILLTTFALVSSSAGRCEIIFTDDFSSGASPQWGNEIGAWTAAGGVYKATILTNFPNAHSSLPFALTDFSVELDINDVGDGGVWLRSALAPGTSVGRTGVLLVNGGFFSGGNGLYWHVVTDGNTYGGAFNIVSGLFTPGVSDPRIRVEVVGNTYSAYVDGASEPATTITTNAFASGQIALYDFSSQTFDNVVVDEAAGVSAAPPRVRPESLRLAGLVGGATQRQALQIRASGGTLIWRASVTLLNGTGWLVASPPSGTATVILPSALILDVNFGAFPTPGTYQAEILIENTAGGGSVRVPVTVVASPAGSRLLLSQSSFVFRTAAGGTPPPQALRIINGGLGDLNWTIPANLTALQNRLQFSELSGTATAGRTGASSTVLSISTAGLSAGVYHALVPVSAPGAANDPQLVTVTLNVAPAATPASPELSSHGLLFVIQEGEIEIPVNDLFAGNTGGGSATFQFQTMTETGGNWLSITPSSGVVSAQAANVSVEIDLTELPLGTYRGRITATFAPGGTRVVEVVLIYAGFPFVVARELPRAAQCAAESMEMVVTSVGTGSVVPVSFPRPLLATVVDSCGSGLSDATVVAAVEGLNISMASLGDGFYSGTWVPVSEAAEVTMTFVALHGTYATVERTITVAASAAAGLASLPVLSPDGVVEGAGFTSRRPLAPGGIISIFGSGFAAVNTVATQLPLERTLSGVSVRIGTEDIPLYFAGPGQINAQVPYSLQSGDSVSVVVNVNGQLTAPQSYLIAPAQPGIFIAGANGAILDGQSRAITAENPAQRGDTLQIFTTGPGVTDPPAATGEAAPAFSTVLLPVTVTIGGVEAPVAYQGLAPGFVGLYQVNAVLPSTVAPGDAVLVEIRQNGIVSNPDLPATIPVR